MNEKVKDKQRIDDARDALLHQRLVVLAAITKLEVGLELLRELIDVAPFAGMPTFENDALTVMDHLRETTREIWAQIGQMIQTINGQSICPANRHVLPASSQKGKVVKVQCQLGSTGVWMQATPEHLVLYDSHETLRLSIPLTEVSERERVFLALVRVAQFVEDTGTA